ncbi:MAG: M48 family metallopeptidase [Bacteroidota bacterium]
MKFIFWGILCVLPLLCFAQVQYNYSPSSHQSKLSSDFIQHREVRLSQDLLRIPLKGKALKRQRDIYQHRFERLKQRGKDAEFLFDDLLEPYCQKVFQNILVANSHLPAEDIHLLVSRSAIPNASCLGEGTIIINLGLLSRLKTEAQLAFVLCHEIAHYVQNHVNEHIQKRVVTFYSKETQQKLREIRNSKYNQNAQALDLLQAFTYDSHRHGRFKESEADSIGLILLSNTSYPPNASIQVMSILEAADLNKYEGKLDLNKHLHHPSYPLKESYFRYEADTTFSYSNGSLIDWNEDSLRTHPDTHRRMQALARQLSSGRLASLQKYSPQASFTTVSQMSDFEILVYDFSRQAYGKALYQSLIILEVYPDNLFLRAMISICMSELYLAKLDHRLSQCLDFPDRLYSDEYNQFLHFFNSLRLKEYKELIYLYLEPLKDKCLGDEFCGLAYIQMSQINEKAGSALELKGQYQKRFPKGRYQKQIEDIFD